MLRRALTLVAMFVVLVAPLRADLKYTMTTQARESKVPSTTPPNPLMTMLSSMVLGMVAPPGGLETTVVVGEKGMRVEYSKAYTVVPAGGAMIMTPDGMVIVVNPAAKTYWKSARANVTAALGKAPTVSVKSTGEFATIAGLRAERSAVEIRVALPVPAGMPGLPAELVMTGDAWLSDRYKNYSTMAGGLSAVGSLGMDQLAASGLMMRSVMRSDLFGNQEIESVVTSVGEVSVPAAAYEAPAGYTQVDPPAMGLPIGTPR